MSLHAQLSPEAEARLKAQQRNSTITSIIISVLAILLVGVILLFMFLDPIENDTPDIVSYTAGKEDVDKPQHKDVTRSVTRKPSAPSNSMAKVIAANTMGATAIPVPDIDVPEVSTDFGDDNDFSDEWSTDASSGFNAIPSDMRERCSKQDRLSRLKNNGGNEACEEAVMKTLHWLNKTQHPDGSWGGAHKVAMTGFAVLVYLAHCETPNSQEFGDAVTAGIVYLVNISMKNGGKMATNNNFSTHWSYEHGIATYALGEAATFCLKLGITIPNLKEATKMAGDFILKHQHKNGSWTYQYDYSNSHDNSVGLWQIQALKACKHTGLWKDSAFRGVMRKALDYIKKSQNKDGGIGYKIGGSTPWAKGCTLSGAGALAFQMWGKSHDSVVRKAAKYILKNDLNFNWNSEHADLYRHYYDVQTMINRGGKEWETYNNVLRDQVLKNQNPDGSYKVPGKNGKVDGVGTEFMKNVHYRTCLATFMLEVYYRFTATGAKTH